MKWATNSIADQIGSSFHWRGFWILWNRKKRHRVSDGIFYFILFYLKNHKMFLLFLLADLYSNPPTHKCKDYNHHRVLGAGTSAVYSKYSQDFPNTHGNRYRLLGQFLMLPFWSMEILRFRQVLWCWDSVNRWIFVPKKCGLTIPQLEVVILFV